MARIDRKAVEPYVWKIAAIFLEPSTHGTTRTFRDVRVLVAMGGTADIEQPRSSNRIYEYTARLTPGFQRATNGRPSSSILSARIRWL